MKARILVRLENAGGFSPKDQTSLLRDLRRLAAPHGGAVVNLRVSRRALEFDLFCAPEQERNSFFSAWLPLGRRLTEKRLDVPAEPLSAGQAVHRARRLFAEERYWEVHEVLEGPWKKSAGAEKRWLQGLIVAAAALVHGQRDERDVAPRMMREALARLDDAPAKYHGWNLERLQETLSSIMEKGSRQ